MCFSGIFFSQVAFEGSRGLGLGSLCAWTMGFMAYVGFCGFSCDSGGFRVTAPIERSQPLSVFVGCDDLGETRTAFCAV